MQDKAASKAQNRSSAARRLPAALAFTALIATATPALALDGCLVYTC